MSFTAPAALFLLLVLVPLAWLGWPRLPFRRARDTMALALRTVIVVLIVLALAGVQSVRPADRLAIAFLVDTSDSVGGAAQATQIAFVRDAVAALRPVDQAAVIAFGADALVERPLTAAPALADLAVLRSTPQAGNTDLEEAISLALAILPADAARRIVILGDGEQTVGDALSAARRAAAQNVEIGFVPYRRAPSPEIQLADVRVPATVSAGQSFDIALTIEADQDAPAVVTVFADGAILATQPVDLRAGTNNYSLTVQAGEAGFTDFRVQVDPRTVTGAAAATGAATAGATSAADGFFQNNTLSAFSRVIGPPRVLIVRDDPAESASLAAALTAAGLIVDQAAPSGLPLGLAGLEAYESVLLANVPASRLTERRMELLETYVRDLGGGLVLSGGPDSFAPGGYFQTPLEAALPIDLQLRDQQRLPQLTITYVIDRSGSMLEVGPSGVENIELAKEAIIRSLNFLQPTDRAGVVSFDTEGYWIADVQPVLDRSTLQALVGSLRASGGTDILAGLRLAGTALEADPSPRRHIIILTDGGAQENGLVTLTRRLFEEQDITTSVIAIGGAPTGFLAEMAAAGGGNYHPVAVVEQIPTIFTQEAVLATRAYISEATFTPAQAAQHPILNGFASAPPALRGYVASTARPTAQTILTTGAPHNDPLLAAWQYGLGRAVAFTSDASGRWAADWLAWPEYPRFWDQTVRWTITEGADANLDARVIVEGETARLVVDARTDEGAFLDGLALTTALIDPTLQTATLPLAQTAPGRYEAVFTPGAEGAYFLGISGDSGGEGDDRVTYSQTTGWVNAYSAEYAIRGVGEDGLTLLNEIAALTGGRSLAGDPAATPLAPLLLLVALLLWPVDIAVRRLLITRSDLAKARAALFRRQVITTDDDGRLQSLRGAKARAAARTTAEVPAMPSSAATPTVTQQTAVISQPTVTPSPGVMPPPTDASPPGSTPRPDDENIAAALLRKRRRD